MSFFKKIGKGIKKLAKFDKKVIVGTIGGGYLRSGAKHAGQFAKKHPELLAAAVGVATGIPLGGLLGGGGSSAAPQVESLVGPEPVGEASVTDAAPIPKGLLIVAAVGVAAILLLNRKK